MTHPQALGPEHRSLARRVAGRLRRIVRRLRRRALRRFDPVPSASERSLRKRLRRQGASLHPRRPAGIWRKWPDTALRTHAQVEQAMAEITACGLPPHPERTKNWDLLIALGLILERTPTRGAILEMGSTQYSKLLPWLYLYGYRSLVGIDLVYDAPILADPIVYRPMDLTRTTFADASFDAIACLSVIEHGVDLASFASESARLLRPGGILVASTDYWHEPVDTGGQEAYGVPIRILTPADMTSLVDAARAAGLRELRPFDPRCEERVVRWAHYGLEYTFAAVAFERPR